MNIKTNEQLQQIFNMIVKLAYNAGIEECAKLMDKDENYDVPSCTMVAELRRLKK